MESICPHSRSRHVSTFADHERVRGSIRDGTNGRFRIHVNDPVLEEHSLPCLGRARSRPNPSERTSTLNPEIVAIVHRRQLIGIRWALVLFHVQGEQLPIRRLPRDVRGARKCPGKIKAIVEIRFFNKGQNQNCPGRLSAVGSRSTEVRVG